MFLYFIPTFLRSLVLLPDKDFSIERASGQDGTEAWVSPRDGMNGTVVAGELID